MMIEHVFYYDLEIQKSVYQVYRAPLCWTIPDLKYPDLKNSLKIHEENTKKITAVLVVLYVIKFHVNLHKL